jgi:hypothetical protein
MRPLKNKGMRALSERVKANFALEPLRRMPAAPFCSPAGSLTTEWPPRQPQCAGVLFVSGLNRLLVRDLNVGKRRGVALGYGRFEVCIRHHTGLDSADSMPSDNGARVDRQCYSVQQSPPSSRPRRCRMRDTGFGSPLALNPGLRAALHRRWRLPWRLLLARGSPQAVQ